MSINDTSVVKSRRGRPRGLRRTDTVARAQDHCERERPMTLRHLWYLLLSDGTIKLSRKSSPSKRAKEDAKNYRDLSQWIVDARMEGQIAFASIVDGLRTSIKSSSWSGLKSFAKTVRETYRKDLWARQSDYIEFWFEKDAIIGVVEDIAEEYDVKMRPLRGQSSLTYLHQAAFELAQIQKPIFIYYFGDHDPSGYSIEDSARNRLQSLLWTLAPLGSKNQKVILDVAKFPSDYDADDSTHVAGIIEWERLGFKHRDLNRTDIIPLEAKQSDTNYPKFLTRFDGDSRAAELDALPTDVIRARMEQTINDHIDQAAWKRLQRIEKLEKESVEEIFAKLGRKNP